MPRATPTAYQLAKEIGFSLTGMTGTGKNGYITEDDVRAAARKQGGFEIPEPPAEIEVELEPDLPVMSAAAVDDREIMSPAHAGAWAETVVLPVSVIEHLRFRQDDAYGEFTGKDLLALRTPVGQPNIPANINKREIYPVDFSYFVKPEPVSDDEPEDDWPELGDTGHPVAEGAFALSE